MTSEVSSMTWLHRSCAGECSSWASSGPEAACRTKASHPAHCSSGSSGAEHRASRSLAPLSAEASRGAGAKSVGVRTVGASAGARSVGARAAGASAAADAGAALGAGVLVAEPSLHTGAPRQSQDGGVFQRA